MSPGYTSPLTRFILELMTTHLPIKTVNSLAASACFDTRSDAKFDGIDDEILPTAERIAADLAVEEKPEEYDLINGVRVYDAAPIQALYTELFDRHHKKYSTNVILIHPEYMVAFSKLRDSSFDRETERRLLSLGIMGYLCRVPVIMHRQVSKDPGFIIV